jgi:hypothetical protein
MNGMTAQILTNESEFNDQLTALENEVQMATPDPNKVSILAANLLTRVDAMSKMKRSARTLRAKKT